MLWENKLECFPLQANTTKCKDGVYPNGTQTNKVECLVLASLCSLVKCLPVRHGAYPWVEHLKGLSHCLTDQSVEAWWDKTLAYLRAAWENLKGKANGMPRPKHSSLFCSSVNREEESLKIISSRIWVFLPTTLQLLALSAVRTLSIDILPFTSKKKGSKGTFFKRC